MTPPSFGVGRGVPLGNNCMDGALYGLHEAVDGQHEFLLCAQRGRTGNACQPCSQFTKENIPLYLSKITAHLIESSFHQELQCH